jgi:hypothetical protein
MGSTLLLLAAVACSSDNTDGNNNNGNGTMSATIDGQAWTGNLATAATYQNNILAFAGTNNSFQINITLTGVTGTGTITLGSGQLSIATVATVSTTPQTWLTSSTGGSGSVVITSLSSTGAAGTFSFTGVAAGGGATGTKAVTSGQFNVTF